jgi:ABC-type phosphate/phosphonate transport system substrate-binding protein
MPTPPDPSLRALNASQSSIFISKVSSYRNKPIQNWEFLTALEERIVEKVQHMSVSLDKPIKYWLSAETRPAAIQEDILIELKRAVEGSHAFVAVLQPEYFSSQYCIAELLFFWMKYINSDRDRRPMFLKAFLTDMALLKIDSSIVSEVGNRLCQLRLIEKEVIQRVTTDSTGILGMNHAISVTSATGVQEYNYAKLDGLFASNFVDKLAEDAVAACVSDLAYATRIHTPLSTPVIRLGIVPMLHNSIDKVTVFQERLDYLVSIGAGRNCRFEVVGVLDYRDAIERLVNDEIIEDQRLDGAFLGPSAYREAILRDPSLLPVAVRGSRVPSKENSAGHAYHWLMIGQNKDWATAKRTQGAIYTSCEELRRALCEDEDHHSLPKTAQIHVGFSDQDSTSGFVRPNDFLNRSLGIGMHDWASVNFCKSHDLTFYWISSPEVRRSMIAGGYDPQTFPQQVRSFSLKTRSPKQWSGHPCLAMIDSEVFSYMSDRFPASPGRELVVVWQSPCAEHQYPWVARDRSFKNGPTTSVSVKDAINDVLTRIQAGDTVMDAFAAREFYSVDRDETLIQREEEANKGRKCKGNLRRGRCGVCIGCLCLSPN